MPCVILVGVQPQSLDEEVLLGHSWTLRTYFVKVEMCSLTAAVSAVIIFRVHSYAGFLFTIQDLAFLLPLAVSFRRGHIDTITHRGTGYALLRSLAACCSTCWSDLDALP